MPRATNEIFSEGWIGDKKAEYEGLKIPAGVDAALVGSQYYAYQTTYKDGTKEIQWFKRGPGAGLFPGLTGAKPPPDDVVDTSEETVPSLKTEWDKGQAEKPPTQVIAGVPHERGPDGIYRPVQTTTGPAGSQPTAQTPAQQNDAELNRQRAKNAALPGPNPQGATEEERRGQDPRYETDEDRATRAATTIKEQGAAAAKTAADARADEAKKDQTVTGTEYVGTGKARKKVTTYQSGRTVTEDAATNATATGVTYEPDGTKVTTYDDGTTTREQQSPQAARAEREATTSTSARKPIIGKDGKPYTEVTEKNPVTGVTRTYHLNEAGQEVTLPGSAMAGIKGLPSYTPDLTKPGAGLIDRAKQLDEMMAAGQLTYEQRQEVLAQDQVLATTVANEFNAGVSLLQTNYANQTSQRNTDVSNVQHRASLANSHMQNAIGLMEHFAPYLGNTKGATGKLFMSAMAAQLGLATQYGGMQNIPREQMDPAVAAWAHRAVAGAGGPGTAPGAAPGGMPAPGAPPAAPGVPPGAPGLPGQAPAPALGPARNRFDTGPGNTLGPRVMTPSSATGGPSLTGSLPPPPQGYEPALSWRAGAQQREMTSTQSMFPPRSGGSQEDFLASPDPNAVGTGTMAFGAMLPPVAPTDPMGGPMDFGAGVGQSPLAMQSAVPGLTPEQDEQARRELDRQIFAGARG